MTSKKISPGVSRGNRISDEGLMRLEKQMQNGTKISHYVLAQWIKRYGESARKIIKKYNQYNVDFDFI